MGGKWKASKTSRVGTWGGEGRKGVAPFSSQIFVPAPSVFPPQLLASLSDFFFCAHSFTPRSLVPGNMYCFHEKKYESVPVLTKMTVDKAVVAYPTVRGKIKTFGRGN